MQDVYEILSYLSEVPSINGDDQYRTGDKGICTGITRKARSKIKKIKKIANKSKKKNRRIR